MKKKAKKPTTGKFMIPMAQLTGSEIAVRVARPALRVGTEIGLGVLGNTAKISASKYRWVVGAVAATAGVLGEIFVGDSQLGRTVKGVAEGMSSWGLRDTIATLLPDLKAKMGLQGLGQQSAIDTGNEENEWAKVAAQLRAEQGAALPEQRRPMEGVNDEYGSNWVADAILDGDDELGELNDKLCA